MTDYGEREIAYAMEKRVFGRFLNTLEDLTDCCEHMEDMDLSCAEQEARKWLIQLCQHIACYYATTKDKEEHTP